MTIRQPIRRRMAARGAGLAAALLALVLLAGCAAGGAGGSASGAPSGQNPLDCEAGSEPAPACEDVSSLVCRIADGAGQGELLLAAQNSEGEGLYRLTVGEDTPLTLDNREATAGQLRNGMLVTVVYGGGILESYPAQFGQVIALQAVTAGQDDRCGLALGVFEDLWGEDPGLNSDITYLGFAIDEALLPCAAERQAVAWRFAELHGCQPLTGSWQQLADEGYINAEELYWEDGLFLSLTAEGEEAQTPDRLSFEAQKWRSGLGAYFFVRCTARPDSAGHWSYERGGVAIA